MIDSVLGNLHFNTGWKVEAEMNLFGMTHRIIIKAHAYYETDGLTSEQKRAFADYKCHDSERHRNIEPNSRGFADSIVPVCQAPCQTRQLHWPENQSHQPYDGKQSDRHRYHRIALGV